jgi:hypothetical protein
MKRAVTFHPYRQTEMPVPPPGVVQATIDSDTGELATPHCPRTETAYFVAGTQPGEYCHLHYLQPVLRRIPVVGAIAGAIAGAVSPSVSPSVEGPAAPAAPPANPAVTPAAQISAPAPAPPVAAAPPPEPPQPRRRGFFGRIVGVFRGGSDEPESGKR